MIRLQAAALAALVSLVSAPALHAQELSRYRDYALGTSLASVVAVSGARVTDVRTLHERPARIQELAWRAPYVRTGAALADPVRDVVFSFYDDQLYQVVVTYDRDRMEGLSNDDLIESISAIYGVPVLRHARTAADGPRTGESADTTIVARWEDDAALLTLTRGTYSPQHQLVLVSKALDDRARGAITEASRLDVQEAPQRELDERNQRDADRRDAGKKARVLNKPAFRP